MSAPQPICPKRLAANRANAQFSTGPTTSEGKAKSSLNAVKTGLTGRTVLLPTEDAEAYEAHLLHYVEAYAPVGEREIQLVQSLADTQWRLDRIPNLEAGFFALGRLRCAELFLEEKNPQVRRAMMDAHILIEDARHFKNLHLQESRLRRQYRQDMEELRELQGERKEAESEQTELQKKPAARAAATSNGFEFTNIIESPKEGGKPAGRSEGNGPVLVCTGSV
jgi:hypothetical protein